MEDGAIIRVRQHGNRDGARLVMAHGNGFAADAYFPFWHLLADHYEIVLYDLRNHGHNPRHDVTHHDIPWFAKDMERVYHGIEAAFGTKPTAGLFHSISGVTAICHALETGGRWDALILFDPPLVPSPGHPLNDMARDFELMLAGWSKTRPDRFSSVEELADQFASSKSLSRWVEGSHLLMAQSILRQDAATDDWVLCCPREGESQIYQTNSELHLWPRLGELKGPVMFIASDPDDRNARAPGPVNRALHEEFGYPYEAVPGTTHMLQIEKPEECARIASDFLDKVGFGK